MDNATLELTGFTIDKGNGSETVWTENSKHNSVEGKKDSPSKSTSNGHIMQGSHDDEEEKPIGILGTGNYGTALAKRCELAGIKYLVGSRRPERIRDVHVTSYEKVLNGCDTIIFAIPRHAYDSVTVSLGTLLHGKTIVEISNLEKRNDPSNALYLQSVLSKSYVVKALNSVSAYTLEHDAYGATRDTFVCGDNRTSRENVMQFCREIGLNAVDRGRLHSAVAIEKLPFRFFEHWGTALIITGCTLVPIMLYYYLRLFWANSDTVDKEKHHLPLYHANRVMAWLALWVLSLTYLPGCVAGFIQLAWGTKYKRFPGWLDRWMKCRKQLGLIALLIAGMHMCMSCILMGAEYMKYMLKRVPIPGTGAFLMRHMEVQDEASILFATLALTSMSIIGVTSLPSVNARMSWKEWDFVQRGIGFATLIFSFLHVILYVYNLYEPDNPFNWAPFWKHSMPPGAFVMPMLPALVILLKLILLLPGVVCYLDKIRSGKIGNGQDKYEVLAVA